MSVEVELTNACPGLAIRPPHEIPLITAVFDIEIKVHWVQTEEMPLRMLRHTIISRSWLIWVSRSKSSPLDTARQQL